MGASLALVACIAGGWLGSADYNYRPPHPPPVENPEARGLTVLVSFLDRPFDEGQAALLYRALNEKDFVHSAGGVTYRGSLRDYYSDMSQGKFELTSEVVHISLPYNFADFDTSQGDDLGYVSSTTQLEDIEFVGSLARITQAVVCKLADCGTVTTPVGWLIDKNVQYQPVDASGFGAPQFSGDVFAELSRHNYTFWFDHFMREIANSPTLLDHVEAQEWVDIPRINGFHYVSMVYSGNTNQPYGKGLYPRSVPQGKTVLDPGSYKPIMHPQILGTGSSSGLPNLALFVHESAHTLFDLPDLYDSGLERDMPSGTLDFQSRGVGTHCLMGYTPSSGEAPMLSAPLRDRLGWAHVIDISDLPEGTVVNLDANSAQTARYCRPGSAMQECFYIEARLRGGTRMGKTRSTHVPDSGLAIWHAEYRKDIVDFVVNNHEEGDRNLHFEVALMQADGQRELEAGINSEDDDYFRAGRRDYFDEYGDVNSKWWDGSPSGLSIRNISAAGPRMSFVVGKRPATSLLVSDDAHVRASFDPAPLRVGEVRKLSISVDPGFSYDVIAPEDDYLVQGRTTSMQLDVPGTLDGTRLRLQSYPSAAGAPVEHSSAAIRFQIAQGATVSAYAAEAHTYEGTSRTFDRDEYWARFNPSIIRNEPDMRLSLSENNRQLALQVVAEEGHALSRVHVESADGSYFRTYHGPTQRFVIDETLPLGAAGSETEYSVEVEAEPIPSYFCSPGRIPEWKPDKVYSDIGDKVLFNGSVYVSNVPRNYLRSAPSGATPENSPLHWTKFLECGATTSCINAPAWFPRIASTLAHKNGLLYSRAHDTESYSIPGNHEGAMTAKAAELFAHVNPEWELYTNRLFAYPHVAEWTPDAICHDLPAFRRAVVQAGAGVTQLVSNQPFVGATAEAPRLTRDLHFVPDVAPGWRLSFQLEPGYTLQGVYVGGVALSPVTVGSSFPITVPSGAPAPFVEIRTSCASSQCRTTTVVPPAAVECKIVVDSQWNSPSSSGFNGRMTIKNLTSARLTSWSTGLSLRPSAHSWQNVWTSVGANVTQSGPDATLTKTNTSLNAGQSTTFSFGGQWGGPFVTPTCTGR